MAAIEPKITYTSTPEEIEAMQSRFDEALEDVAKDYGTSYPMIIDGKDRTEEATFDVVAPADTDKILARFPKGTQKDVDDALAVAKAYQSEWRRTPWEERVKLVKSAANMVRARKFKLAAIMIEECGKSRTEAIGEVEEGADLLDYYADVFTQNDAYHKPMASEDPREANVSVLLPVGVWGIMAPFNFPNALAAGPIGAALVTGNTVVFKPASATALSGYELARALLDGGIPAGALQFVTGGGSEVGDYLVHHPDTDGVVFTGSKETGMELHRTFSTDYPKPIITEMGGKNPTIVTDKADLDKAVEGVVRSAFGFSGQKCSACSRAYVQKDIYDEFMDRLVKRTGELKVGDPVNREVFVGPVIDESAVARFEDAVEVAKHAGGHIRFGGTRLTEGDYASGTFVEPTIVDNLPLDNELFKRELFLPFLAVAPVDSLEQALKESNDVEYGLTAGIFSEDENEINEFFDNIEAGVVYANRKGGSTTGAWPGSQPFCGWKGSGSSGKGALGSYYPMLFMREQSRTVVTYDE
ncbi:MAG TPA: aldehyde dehydrogenase family protein [Thermomicrobiales bacterium]|nr:aldehyde dehydrogenase family protein [Thermomicrobiales bacterium]